MSLPTIAALIGFSMMGIANAIYEFKNQAAEDVFTSLYGGGLLLLFTATVAHGVA